MCQKCIKYPSDIDEKYCIPMIDKHAHVIKHWKQFGKNGEWATLSRYALYNLTTAAFCQLQRKLRYIIQKCTIHPLWKKQDTNDKKRIACEKQWNHRSRTVNCLDRLFIVMVNRWTSHLVFKHSLSNSWINMQGSIVFRFKAKKGVLFFRFDNLGWVVRLEEE